MIRVIPAGILNALIEHLTAWQGKWFDWTRGVQTSGYEKVRSLTLAGSEKSGFNYLPTRPARAREVLRSLPLSDFSQYSFLDLGSGKGRMLFLAAEFPFRRVAGIEFAAELHDCATRNIARYRRIRSKCRDIQSVHVDAAEYQFPDGNLVVYLFNPFGPPVLEKVMSNLKKSLDASPRHVIVVLVTPEHRDVVDALPWLTCYRATRQYRIYQARG